MADEDAASGPLQLRLPGAVTLASGREIGRVTVACETFGELDSDGANAVLVCHALSGDAHVASGPGADRRQRPGWWDVMVGPGKAIDTDSYFVICANVLGGCSGTTGPSSLDPATGRPWGLRFPMVTIEDMIDVQARLLDELGVERLVSVAGGSMGGMQVLAWAKRYPERVASVMPIATTARLGAQAIAFNEVGRRAILGDPAFRGGDYYESGQPAQGLSVARMIGHITYLSDESMRAKFGRRLRDDEQPAYGFVTEFEVESYLEHQGRRFVERFDANTYLYMTRAMDHFDLANGSDSLEAALAGVGCSFLVLSFTSDWLFPTYQSLELVEALRAVGADVTFAEVESAYGHDAFLLEEEGQREHVVPFLEEAARRNREALRAG